MDLDFKIDTWAVKEKFQVVGEEPTVWGPVKGDPRWVAADRVYRFSNKRFTFPVTVTGRWNGSFFDGPLARVREQFTRLFGNAVIALDEWASRGALEGEIELEVRYEFSYGKKGEPTEVCYSCENGVLFAGWWDGKKLTTHKLKECARFQVLKVPLGEIRKRCKELYVVD